MYLKRECRRLLRSPKSLWIVTMASEISFTCCGVHQPSTLARIGKVSGSPWVTKSQASGSVLIEIGNPQRDVLVFDLGAGSLANFSGLKVPVTSLKRGETPFSERSSRR